MGMHLAGEAGGTTTILVVPCYNETRRLHGGEFVRFVDRTSNVHFLFVDDGSIDGTHAMLGGLCRLRPERMEVLMLPRNCGKAEAVRQGMRRALELAPDHIGFWDADLATPLEAIPDFLRVFDDHPDVQMVFGARVQLLGRDIRRKMLRHYLGRCFATAASMALRLPVYDTQCGAKLFRRSEVLGAMLEQPFLSRWIFDVELIARYERMAPALGLPPAADAIYELALRAWHDAQGSKVRMRDFLKAAWELNRIYCANRPVRRTVPTEPQTVSPRGVPQPTAPALPGGAHVSAIKPGVTHA